MLPFLTERRSQLRLGVQNASSGTLRITINTLVILSKVEDRQ